MVEEINLLTAAEHVLCPTGYATVARNLIHGLLKKGGYNIWHVAWQYFGDPLVLSDDNGNKYTELQHGGVDMSSGGNFPEYFPDYLKQFKIDIAWSLIDIWETGYMMKCCNKLAIPYVNYFPQDGNKFYTPFLQKIKYSSYPLCMSKFGRDVVLDAVEKYGEGGWKYHVKDKLQYIWHGVDVSTFRRIEKSVTERNRKQIFTGSKEKEFKYPGGENTFLFFFCGKNAKRKFIDRLISAYSIVAKKYRDVHLALKVGDPMNRHGYGHDLVDIIQHYDMNGRISILDTKSNFLQGISEKELAGWYNLSDCHVSATGGEGFGLTTVESMSCGKPVIITDYTTSRELIGNNERGWLVPYSALAHMDYNSRWALIDIIKMADAMEDAYLNRQEVKRRGNNAYRWVRKNLSWKIIVDQFDKYFRKALDEYGSVSAKDMKQMMDGDVMPEEGEEDE